MVRQSVECTVTGALSLWAQSPLSRLEPLSRLRLFGGLILLTIGGVSLIILCWLALRVGRRALRRTDATLQKFQQRANPEDWAAKPLVKPVKNRSDDIRPNDHPR